MRWSHSNHTHIWGFCNVLTEIEVILMTVLIMNVERRRRRESRVFFSSASLGWHIKRLNMSQALSKNANP